ncbi:hypothetical protein MGI18_23130 [Bacillus sp. OVS6]|nr:hypothetical protein MGI18_23130 [Bacillus sp. OVS6]
MDGFKIFLEVITKPTGHSGVRHSKWSEWSIIKAPVNFVIDPKSIEVQWVSDAGSENSYEILFEDHIQTKVSSLKYNPRIIKVRAFARGPKGYFTGHGWTKISITGKLCEDS